MPANAFIRHAPAHRTVPPLQRQHRPYPQIRQRLKNLVRRIGIVIIPHPRVIPPEHMVRAPQILAHNGVKHRLPRPRVPHIPQQRGSPMNAGAEKPPFPQIFVRQHNGLVNIIPHLLGANDRADQHPVRLRLQKSPLHQILMPRMRHIPGLVRHCPPPPQLRQLLPQLRRRPPEAIQRRVDDGLANQRDFPCHEAVGVPQRPLHSGVSRVVRAVHLPRQRRPVHAENLRHRQRGQRLAPVGQ